MEKRYFKQKFVCLNKLNYQIISNGLFKKIIYFIERFSKKVLF